MTALPPRQQQLHDLLFGKGDVPITHLYAAIFGEAERPMRQQQQWISPYISALNRRLAVRNLKVEPGDLKNSYRLVVMQTQ